MLRLVLLVLSLVSPFSTSTNTDAGSGWAPLGGASAGTDVAGTWDPLG